MRHKMCLTLLVQSQGTNLNDVFRLQLLIKAIDFHATINQRSTWPSTSTADDVGLFRVLEKRVLEGQRPRKIIRSPGMPLGLF